MRLIPYVNEALQYFHEEVLKVINTHAPLKMIKQINRNIDGQLQV